MVALENSTVNEVVVNVGTTATQVLGQDDRRIALLLGTPNTNDYIVRFMQTFTGVDGLRLHANGDPVMLSYLMVGKLVQQAVFIRNVTAAEQILIVEVLSKYPP